MPVADASHSVSGVAQRYASSLYELAREANEVDSVGRDLDGFAKLIEESSDFKRLVVSPVFSADQQLRAISAITEKAGLTRPFGTVMIGGQEKDRVLAIPKGENGFLARIERALPEMEGN